MRKKNRRVSAFLTNESGYTYPDNYTLLDSAVFVYIFHNQSCFTNFCKVRRRRSLLCGQSIVKIEEWGDILLLFRVENWVPIFVLCNITYISKFSLNLISLLCIKDQSLSWNHVLGEIQNASWLISYTTQNSNNYKISVANLILGLSSALMTLAMIFCRSYSNS